MGDLEDLLPALDGTRSRNDTDMVVTHLQIAGRHQGALLLHFRAGHFVRRKDRNHFVNPFSCFQGLFGAVALFSQGGDHGAFRTDNDVAAQSQEFNFVNDVIDLPLAGARFHDNNHGCSPQCALLVVRCS